MRLLVVEDEPRISEIIKAALERAEFAVDTVRLRADAREALANTAYDAGAAFFVIAAYRHGFGTGVRRALASSSPSKF
jgi:DNA-binding NtrC family response regulator